MIKAFILGIISFTLLGCSDNLNANKAKKIINKCEDDIRLIKTVNLRIGEKRFSEKNKYSNSEFITLNRLKDEGVVSFDSLKSSKSGRSSYYSISVTEKGMEFYHSKKRNFYGDYYSFIARKFQVKEVNNIHEIPSLNSAELDVSLASVEKTPFHHLEQNVEVERRIKMALKNTNDKGWIYCESSP